LAARARAREPFGLGRASVGVAAEQDEGEHPSQVKHPV
jgi:hypothetical protein